MQVFIFVYLLTIFSEVVRCTPASLTQHRRIRRRSANAPSNQTHIRPIFNTTLYSTDGTTNPTPTMQTKVYIPMAPASNLTNRGIMGERRIITCDSPTGQFHHSHCGHRDMITASVRVYMRWCREPVPSGRPQPTYTLPSEAQAMASDLTRMDVQDTSLHAEIGNCESDEVCVDSLYNVRISEGTVLIANCVKKKLFIDAGVWNDLWDNEDEEGGAEYWEGHLSEEEEFQEAESGSSSSEPYVSEKGGDNGKGQGKGKGQGSSKANNGEDESHQQHLDLHHLPASIFAGKFASVVVTKDEGDTPLEVEELDLKSLGNGTALTAGDGSAFGPSEGTGPFAGVDTSGNAESKAAEIVEQERNCTNCVRMKTFKPLAPDTEALEMEVKMVGVGTTALAGVLWVALLSG